MKLDIISADIQYRHSQGETYREIGEGLGISAPCADRIAHGKRPGKKVCEMLGIDPSPAFLATKRRRACLNSVAILWGYKSWCAFETAVIKNHPQGETL